MLGQEAPKRVDELGPLPHEQIARSEYRGAGLLLLALHSHKPHVRSLGRLADRLRIGGIVLLPFDERLHISRRDEPHLMPETL